MTRDDVTALLARRREALGKRDFTGVGALYAETAHLESPLGGQMAGREAITKAAWAFFNAFPDATLADEEPVIEGERVALVSRVSGTHKGMLLGIPASGRTFTFTMVTLFVVRGGFIVNERRVYDFTGLMIQLGVLKAKPAL